jgi:hypothetical protein
MSSSVFHRQFGQLASGPRRGHNEIVDVRLVQRRTLWIGPRCELINDFLCTHRNVIERMVPIPCYQRFSQPFQVTPKLELSLPPGG